MAIRLAPSERRSSGSTSGTIDARAGLKGTVIAFSSTTSAKPYVHSAGMVPTDPASRKPVKSRSSQTNPSTTATLIASIHVNKRRRSHESTHDPTSAYKISIGRIEKICTRKFWRLPSSLSSSVLP